MNWGVLTLNKFLLLEIWIICCIIVQTRQFPANTTIVPISKTSKWTWITINTSVYVPSHFLQLRKSYSLYSKASPLRLKFSEGTTSGTEQQTLSVLSQSSVSSSSTTRRSVSWKIVTAGQTHRVRLNNNSFISRPTFFFPLQGTLTPRRFHHRSYSARRMFTLPDSYYDYYNQIHPTKNLHGSTISTPLKPSMSPKSVLLSLSTPLTPSLSTKLYYPPLPTSSLSLLTPTPSSSRKSSTTPLQPCTTMETSTSSIESSTTDQLINFEDSVRQLFKNWTPPELLYYSTTELTTLDDDTTNDEETTTYEETPNYEDTTNYEENSEDEISENVATKNIIPTSLQLRKAYYSVHQLGDDMISSKFKGYGTKVIAFRNQARKHSTPAKGTMKLSKCYECGMTQKGIPKMPGCYDVFDGVGAMKSHRLELKRHCYSGEGTNVTNATYYSKAFIGGCFKRFLDVGEQYYEKGCRAWPPVEGISFASNRFVAVERTLKGIVEGCTFSPAAVLTPFARGISLWVRYHVCVCVGDYCNGQTRLVAPLFHHILVVLYQAIRYYELF